MLSVVTTLYNTSDYLNEFLSKVTILHKKISLESYEVILVDDGSTDSQFSKAQLICANYQNVTLVRLSRNFGHHHALLGGLERASGHLIFLVDSDLEEDPLDFYLLHKEMLQTKADLVYGYQEKRRGGLWEKFSGQFFYFIMNRFMKVEIPENMLTSRLMSRRYLDALLSHRETQLNFSGLSLITGFHQSRVPLTKTRLRKTSYSFSKKLAVMIDAITSFSSSPLKFIFATGIVIFTASTIVILSLLIQWLNNGDSTSGWASLILSVWFLGGLNMLSLGVIGMYTSKIFIETKNRPRVIVSEVISTNEG